MKNLIRKMSFAICTLLLTCTFCLAQIEFKENTGAMYINVSSDSTIVKVGGYKLLTVKLLIEYEIECYNDSTYVISTVDYTPKPEAKNDTLDLTGVYSIIALYSVKGEWRHKEPTFADFVRWVAKKYGL